MPKKYRDYVNAGICPTCKSNKSENGLVLCGRCWENRMQPERKAKQKELYNRYKENNRKLGLCDRCKNEAVEGFRSCQRCLDIANSKTRFKRKEVFDLYGAKCVCCGEDQWEFLTIDHVNGDGHKERKKGFKITHLRNKLLIEGKPNPDYQILCMNCNFAKGIHGYCPHSKNGK